MFTDWKIQYCKDDGSPYINGFNLIPMKIIIFVEINNLLLNLCGNGKG